MRPADVVVSAPGGRFREPVYPSPASKAVGLGVKHLRVAAPIDGCDGGSFWESGADQTQAPGNHQFESL